MDAGRILAAWSPLAAQLVIRAPTISREQISCILATIRCESSGLAHIREIGPRSYFDYLEGRRDLGNVYPGDGYKFRGGGIAQLTGRSNYRWIGNEIGEPLEDDPDLILQPDIGFRAFAAFWQGHASGALPWYADRWNLYRVRALYNGEPPNGLELFQTMAERMRGCLT